MIGARALDPVASAGQIVQFWNANIGDRFPLDERLWRQQVSMGKSESLLLAAFETGESVENGDAIMTAANQSLPALCATPMPLLGLAMAKRASGRDSGHAPLAGGNLSFILVAEQARRRGIGTALLGKIEGWARARGVVTLAMGQDSYHFFPGAPLGESSSAKSLLGFLDARGFTAGGAEHDVLADLGSLDFALLGRGVKRSPGYSVIHFRPELRESLEAFFMANFPGRWRSDTMEALDAGMRKEDLLLCIEDSTSLIVGFSRIYDNSSSILGPGVYWRGIMGSAPCGLGPIGVDESRRGLGLGLRLLYESLLELARRGGRVCAIDWTDLVDFYAKMGFAIWKSYRLYSKNLGGNADGPR